MSGDLDTTTTAQLRVYLAEADNDSSFDGNGTSGIYIYGAQLNSGSTAKTYYPTTTRLNIPRVDYLNNSNGSLLLESQRTNEFKYSNDFANAIWVKTSTTITSDEIASPIYGEMADSILATATTAQHRVLQTPATNGVGAFTMYIKQKELSRIVIHLLGVNKGRGFDCSDNTTFAAIGVAADAAYYNISDFGNGWSKIEVYDGSGATTRVDVYLASPVVGANNSVWTGDGTSKMYISAAQFEQGSYPTSYIPTSGTTVTRLQDTSSTTGLSDVIGQTEGTIYSEFELTEDSTFTILEINAANSTTNRILAYRNGSNIVFIVQVGNVIQINNPTAFTFASINKVAVTYKANDFKIYANGSLLKAYTSGSIPSSLDTLALADNNLSNKHQVIRSLMIFDSVLTNTELATLTTI